MYFDWKMGLSHAKCQSNVRLEGKTVILTGSNTGIGKTTATDLFKRGARVIMACRNLEKANAAMDDIKTSCKDLDKLGELIITELDLSILESVRQCAARLLETEKQINILINNAAVLMCTQSKTNDGFEMQFGTNHLGHFLFTLLLLPRIIKSSPARIINVSSHVHCRSQIDLDDLNYENRPYEPFRVYADSKLLNILFTKELARKLQESNIENVNVYAVNPGSVKTDLIRHINETYLTGRRWVIYSVRSWFMKTLEQSIQTTLHCALDEKAGIETGLYYDECKVHEPLAAANSIQNAQKLWERSIEFVGLDKNYNPFIPK